MIEHVWDTLDTICEICANDYFEIPTALFTKSSTIYGINYR